MAPPSVALVVAVLSVLLMVCALPYASGQQTWYMCATLQGPMYQSVVQATMTVSSTTQQLADYNGNVGTAYTATAVTSGTRTFYNLTAGASSTPVTSTITALAAPGSTGGNDNLFWPSSNPPLDGNGLTFNFSSIVPISGQSSQGQQMNLWWASGSNSADEETAGGTHETPPLASNVTFSSSPITCSIPTSAQFSFCLVLVGSSYNVADYGIITTQGNAIPVAPSSSNGLTTTQQGWLVTSINGGRLYNASGAAGTTSSFSTVAAAASVAGNDNLIYPTYSQLLDTAGVGFSVSPAATIAGQSTAASVISLASATGGGYIEQTTAGAETAPTASYMQISPYRPGQQVPTCAPIANFFTFCWSVQSPNFQSFVSGTIIINPLPVIVSGNTGNQIGYQITAVTGSRTYTDLTTSTTTVSVINNLMPTGSVGGNDNWLLYGSFPLFDGDGMTINYTTVPPIYGQYAAANQTTQMNMWWNGNAYYEENEGGTHEATISSSTFTVTPAPPGTVPPSCSFYLQPLGWYADSTAQTQLQENNEAANDLHCNPIQQYNTLPAAGAYFESFSTFYDASSVSGPTPSVRMALYQITPAGVWNLLVATQTGSDLMLPASSAGGGTLATSMGPFYYGPSASQPVVIYPMANYSICFSNNAIGLGGTAHMFLWPQGGGLVNYALTNYNLSAAQVPVVFDAVSTAGASTTTWQVWFTVAALGTGPATGGTPTPAPNTPPDYNSVCYGAYVLNPQNVTTFNYQFTLGCVPNGFSWGWQGPAGGTSCVAAVNGTGGSFMVVNITLVMLLSSASVYGSGANAAYQICSLLPGSTRTIGTWISAQTGLQYQTTDLQIVPQPNPGSGFTAIALASNNWFYPFSGTNNPNGPASTTPYGLPYYFDGYGILYSLGQSWNGVTYLNLFTSSGDGNNWVIAQGGSQLMEENGQGPFGYIIEDSWKISVSTTPWRGCQNLAANTPVTNWTWMYGYTAACTSLYSYTGCTVGSGYYNVNYTLNLQTVSTPLFDNGKNSPFMICSILPGSTRTQVMNPTGAAGAATTTTSTVTLAPITANNSWYYNNYFYPFSATNGANGANDGLLGLYYWFDNYGLVVQLNPAPLIGGVSNPYINLCTGNGALSGGSQLMEETPTGQFGQILNNQSFYASVGPTQDFDSGGCPSAVGTQVVHLFTFNLVYVSQCTSAASLPNCYSGNSTYGYDNGYYTLNLTLFMITGVLPATNNPGTNAGYRTCQLLPGSQRITANALTGALPYITSTPLTLLYNPNPTQYSSQSVLPSGGFNYDNFFYPYTYVFGEYGGGLNNGNDGGDNPNYYGSEFFFDNFGMVYLPSTPWLGTFPYINLCTSNPTTNSLNPDQLTEEDPLTGAVGVVNGWKVSLSMQRFVQQSSFYFSYSASGPLAVSTTSGVINAPYSTVINGILTVVATSTAGLYQIINMYATRSSTNYNGATTTTPLSLVGVGMAGSNNNLLYVGNSQFPLGMDGQGWGVVSNQTSLYPTTVSSSTTLPAGTPVQWINGIVEVATGQSTPYNNPSMIIVPYSATAMATMATLPTSATVANFSSSIVYYPNNTVIIIVNQTVVTYYNTTTNTTVQIVTIQNNTVTTVYVPGQNNTVYVSSGTSGSSLSNGAVAGIVIGCSIGFALLCVLITIIFLRSADNGKQTNDPQTRGEATRKLDESQPMESSTVSRMEEAGVHDTRPEVEMH